MTFFSPGLQFPAYWQTMASAFAHAVLGATLGGVLLPARRAWPWWLLAAGCAVLPDADALGYRLGVPYGSLWGHRGLTHSLLAAAVVATLATVAAAGVGRRPALARVWGLLWLATASHGLLDALTTGGLGVAFFSPFDPTRYFFPFRPIRVSPLGVRAFFGAKGRAVLASEAVWVGLPCAGWWGATALLRGCLTRPARAGG